MNLWAKARGLPAIAIAATATIVVLGAPISDLQMMASPQGASLAVSCLVALAVPIAIGWGFSRSATTIERVAVRSILILDLALVGIVAGTAAGLAVLMDVLGLAHVGAIAARAELVYTGLLLATRSLGTWRVAAVGPTVYVLTVAVVGRGDDLAHPAWWAWIAASPSDIDSWLLTALALIGGFTLFGLTARSQRGLPSE